MNAAEIAKALENLAQGKPADAGQGLILDRDEFDALMPLDPLNLLGENEQITISERQDPPTVEIKINPEDLKANEIQFGTNKYKVPDNF